MNTDTIVAIATPPAHGGIGVVRISGSQAPKIAKALTRRLLSARHAHYLPFYDSDGSILETGIALYFSGPNSFTGESILELHCHGSPVLLNLLVKRIIQLGARPARPGEFTERAYLNGKIDLTQAEAISDLINSSTDAAARSAQRSLQGEFSKRVHEIIDDLIQIRTFLEAAIDFSDEEIDHLSESNVENSLLEISKRLEAIQNVARQGSLLSEGLYLVIAGKPNAGKSSLMNRLSGDDVAIVTDIPGTTRDILKNAIQIDGMPLHIIDTAGIRESDDIIEMEGINRAKAAVANADMVLLIIDDTESSAEDAHGILTELTAGRAVIKVHNKIDLSGRQPQSESGLHGSTVYLSAKTGEGIPLLINKIKEIAGFRGPASHQFSARQRHLDALARAHAAIKQALDNLTQKAGVELIAEELRLAQNSFGEITGEFATDDLLREIFSKFCIGK